TTASLKNSFSTEVSLLSRPLPSRQIPRKKRKSYAGSPDLVQHPIPARPCEEVGEHRPQASQGRTRAFSFVILALRFVRPVNEQRLALDVIALQESPVAAVL